MSASSQITASFDGIRSVSAGTTNATGSQIVFSNSNNISFGANGQTITASFSQSVQPDVDVVIAAGTQTATSGTAVLSNSNGISFGMSGSSQITASFDGIRSVSAGTSNATGSQIFLVDSNGISFGASGNSITASYTQSTQADVAAIGLSNFGNTLTFPFLTSGTTQGTIVFNPFANISIGQSDDTNGATFFFSVGGGVTFDIGSTVASGNVVVSFVNSNGISFGLSDLGGGNFNLTASFDGIRSISAGTTNVTGSQVVFSNSNGISFGANGQTITASFSQSVQPDVDVVIAAGTQTATSGTAILSNSNGVSFGMSGSSRITASFDGIRSVSAGTTNATGSQIVFSNSNNISFGANGQTITASFSQSVQPDVDVVIAAGTQTATSGTAVFSNSNGITFGMSNSSQITASFDGIRSISAGTTNVTGSQVVFSNSNNISFGANGQTITASFSQSVQPDVDVVIAAGTQTATSGTAVFSNSNGITFGMSNSSVITASVSLTTTPAAISAGTTLASTGTIVFSNSNSISFGMNGNTITASFSTQPETPFAISAGTQSVSTGTVQFSNSNGVSFGMNLSFKVTASFDGIRSISAGTSNATGPQVVFSNSNGISFGASNQTLTASFDGIRSISAGTTNVTGSQIVFSNSNNISFGANGQTITASFSQSVQPDVDIVISAGTNSQSTGTVLFANSNGVSFGLDAIGILTASVAGVEVIAGTSVVTSIVILSFANSNGVSFGLSGSTLTASVLPETPFAISAGTQSVSTGTVSFANSNGITFGMSGSSQITATADYVRSISAGTTNATGNQIVFADANGISFGANGQTVTASINNGIIAIGAGTQTATSGTVIFSNSNGFTFGMSGSSQITLTYERRITAFSQWAEFATNFSISNATLSLQKVSMPMHLSATRAALLMDLSGNSGSTGALTISMGIYTLSGSTASLASSGSRVISWTSGSATSATSVYGGASGTRYRSIPINFSMTPGDYVFAFHMRTTNDGTWRAFGRLAASIVGSYDGIVNDYYVDGVSVSSFTTAFGGSINVTDTNYVRTGAAALRQPGVILIGTY